MHNRIIQVSKMPIDKEDYICARDYEDHWFTKSIADYVFDDCDREKDIEWLASDGLSIERFDGPEVLIVRDKHKFFDAAYAQFREAINKAQTMTLDDFCSFGTSYIPFMVKDAYEDKYGFYIDNGDELMSLYDWIRYVEQNTPYYTGGTVDYHS